MTDLLHSSLLPLQGGINFRDQGGNVGIDGRRVKPKAAACRRA